MAWGESKKKLEQRLNKEHRGNSLDEEKSENCPEKARSNDKTLLIGATTSTFVHRTTTTTVDENIVTVQKKGLFW